MSKEELSFEELSDGSKIITIKGINQFGETYIRQDRINCPAIWDALKRVTYTAKDMETFAEWTAIMQWIYDPTDKCWFQKHSTETKTTTKLREMWEQERGVNTSKPPNSKQQCPTCGSDSLITVNEVTKVCDYCNGAGWIEEPLRTIPCPACGGKRRKRNEQIN